MTVSELKKKVEEKLSDARFKHTVGVVDAAKRIAREILPDEEEAITVAAYLHDIAKELEISELVSLANESVSLTDDDFESPQILHSFAAPALIQRTFPKFATPQVLSAVFKHTTGDGEMSIFDEIIFIADYIEDGRTYPSCVSVREELWANLSVAKNAVEKENALHSAALSAINATIDNLTKKGRSVNQRTRLAEAHIKQKITGN